MATTNSLQNNPTTADAPPPLPPTAFTTPHPCLWVPPHSPPSHHPVALPQHLPDVTNGSTDAQTAIQARRSFVSSSRSTWTIDNTEGVEIHTDMKIQLRDAHQSIRIDAEVKEIASMERLWIEFHLLVNREQNVTLLVPRVRARLGALKAILHLVLRPWLPDIRPPPVMPTPRSMRQTVNGLSRAEQGGYD